MPPQSFWDHPIETIEEALSLRKQIAALQEKLSGLFGDHPPSVAAKPAKAGKRGGKRVMSPATIAKMRASQQARWAKKKVNVVSPLDMPFKSPKKPVKKKRNLSPEGRARIVAALKARWAAKKKAQK